MLSIVCIYVLSSDVRYDFRMKPMFGSSLPPVVCKRDHVLFRLFGFVYVEWCSTHIVLCFGLFFVVLCIISFSGLSIFDCSFGIL
jgi:hypothetical protein